MANPRNHDANLEGNQTMSLRISSLVLVCSIVFSATTSQAALTLLSLVGGIPVGADTYVNFDNLPLGNTGGTSNGVGVSFTPDGQTVQGSSSGLYAAPFLSNSNGVLFGDSTVSGADATPYLTTGTGSVVLSFPGEEMYMGVLWGSVDTYNTLTFLDGSTVVGSITGANVTAMANGDQGASGTFYVNINSDLAFNKVIATSSQYAFEFDNVAFSDRPFSGSAPEASSLSVWVLLGSLGSAAMLISKKRSLSLGL
jgi:hypothetical protein